MATGTIGAKIVLEGEAEYRKALKDIKTAQAELKSEMKLANAEYKNSQNSMDALTKKYEVLAKEVEQSGKKVEIYEKYLKASSDQEQKAAEKVASLQTKLQNAEKAYEAMNKSSESTAEAMEAQQKAIEDLKTELQTANKDYDASVEATKKYQTQLNNAKSEMKGFENELEQTNRYLDEARANSDKCATSIDEYGNEVVDAGDKTNTFGDVLKANLTSQAIIDGIKTLVNGIKEIATACIDSGMEFEAAMSNVQALSGANATELEKLSDKAKELGTSTIYSATEVADAMSYMSLAGWDTEQTLTGISSVLDLAAASSMDLATASDIVTDYLTAFGLKAEDAEQFTDQLAYTMANSNTTVELLGESYKNCAATAASLGYSVEDVTAVLATMANAGVKGGEAGTALNTVMTRLATNTKGCGDALEKYGVSIYDSEGNMNDLSEILEGLSGVWGTLNDQEQAALAKTIAGTNQYSSFQTIMSGLSETAQEAGMSFTDYEKALEDCNGSASEMADTMQDNLQGKVTALESALEGLKISTFEVFDEGLQEGVEGATNAVSRLNAEVSGGGKLTVSLQKLSKSVDGLIDKVVNWAEKNLPKIVDGLAEVVDHADDIMSAVKGLAAGIVTFKSLTAILATIKTAMAAYKAATQGAAVAQNALNVAADSNPYVLLASAVVGVTVALVSLAKETESLADYYSYLTDETDTLIEETDSLNKSITDAADSRQKSRDELDAEASVSSELVGTLEQLQEAYANGTDNIEQQKAVIAQLNEAYPDLNLSIDEHTGALNQSTAAIKKNIEQLQKQARATAAQTDLEEIAANQYEAEKQKYILEQQLIDAKERQADAQKRYNDALADESGLTDFETPYYELQAYTEEVERLTGEIEVQDGVLATLNDEYNNTVGFVNQAADSFGNAGTAVEGMDESIAKTLPDIIDLSDEVSSSLTNLNKNIDSAITSQIDLFSQVNEVTSQNKEDLIKNLDDQVVALSSWADNLGILAKRGIDENLYEKLAEMGPEGAGYVQAFIDMTDEELKDYGKNFEQALEIEDAVGDNLTKQYAELSGYILDGMALGLEDDGTVTAAMGKVSEDAWEKFCADNGIHSPSTVYRDLAAYIPEGMAEGVKNNENLVIDEIQTTSDDMIQTATDALKNAGEFETIGQQIDQGLADGITQGKSTVVNAIADLCATAVESAKEDLDIHSPSKKFEYLGEMSGEGYLSGLSATIGEVNDTIGTAMGDIGTSSAVANSGTSAIGQIADLIAEYLPAIASNESNVNVSLQGDASGIFEMVRKQNNRYIKQTGSSAF